LRLGVSQVLDSRKARSLSEPLAHRILSIAAVRVRSTGARNPAPLGVKALITIVEHRQVLTKLDVLNVRVTPAAAMVCGRSY